MIRNFWCTDCCNQVNSVYCDKPPALATQNPVANRRLIPRNNLTWEANDETFSRFILR